MIITQRARADARRDDKVKDYFRASTIFVFSLAVSYVRVDSILHTPRAYHDLMSILCMHLRVL